MAGHQASSTTWADVVGSFGACGEASATRSLLLRGDLRCRSVLEGVLEVPQPGDVIRMLVRAGYGLLCAGTNLVTENVSRTRSEFRKSSGIVSFVSQSGSRLA